MSIIINDLDKLLIELCDLESDYFNLMCVNKHYCKLITENILFMQWSVFTQSNKYNFLAWFPLSYLCDRGSKAKTFVDSCRLGLLFFSKYLVFKYNIDIHTDDEAAFKSSCHGGHIDVVMWLIELSKEPGFTPYSDEMIAKYYRPH